MILSFATSVYCWFELVSVGDCLVSVGATLTSLAPPLYKGAPSFFYPQMVSVGEKFSTYFILVAFSGHSK